MILCSKLKNGLCKMVTKSQVVTEFSVTKSRMHCTFKPKASTPGHSIMNSSTMIFSFKNKVKAWA